jgi:hypothetical protein
MALYDGKRYGETRVALGRLEGWVEIICKEFKDEKGLLPTPADPLKQLKILEDALRYFSEAAAEETEKLAQAEAQAHRLQAESTKKTSANVRVTLEGSPEAFDVTNVFVAQNDNPHQWAGSVYQHNESGEGPVLETPPFRVPLTFEEIEAVRALVEKHIAQIPVIRSESLRG